jgi:hypothetical protein
VAVPTSTAAPSAYSTQAASAASRVLPAPGSPPISRTCPLPCSTRSHASSRFAEELPTMQSTMHLYPVDGAVHRVGPADTAWRNRDVTWSEVIVGVDPDPRNATAITRWTVDYWEASHPYSAGGAYVNFMMDEGSDRVRATYGDNYDRLAEVKAAYDPDNVLRINQNIPPRG